MRPPEALEGAWPCHHLDFELVPSRTPEQYVSVVLSHLLVVLFYGSPKTHMLGPFPIFSSYCFMDVRECDVVLCLVRGG